MFDVGVTSLLDSVEIFADLEGKRASDSPPAPYCTSVYSLTWRMQNWDLFYFWNLPAPLILVLIFLLHENVSRRSQNIWKLLLSLTAWVLRVITTQLKLVALAITLQRQ